MTEEQLSPAMRELIEHVAEDAAERAATRTAAKVIDSFLVELGVNAEKPSDRIEVQKDFALLRKFRRSLESKPDQVRGAATIALFSLVGAIILFFLQRSFGSLPLVK